MVMFRLRSKVDRKEKMYEEQKASQTPRAELEQKSLEEAVNRLKEEFSGLEARLQRVTIQKIGAAISDQASVPEPPMSLFSANIRQAHQAIMHVCDAMSSLKQRLDI